MKSKNFRHLGTVKALSAKEAINKVESKEHETKPVPYHGSGNSIFESRIEVPAIQYASEVMNQSRIEHEKAITSFLLSNREDMSDKLRLDAIVFSYVIEWLALVLSQAPKEEVQILMLDFTSVTSLRIFNNDSPQSIMTATDILQNGIKIYSGALDRKTNGDINQISNLLVSYFLELTHPDAFVKKGNEISTFIEIISKGMMETLKRNETFISTYRVKNTQTTVPVNTHLNSVNKSTLKKDPVMASDLADVTCTYIERAEKILLAFLLDNSQKLTLARQWEIVAFSFNIYRLGINLSSFSPEETDLVIKQLFIKVYTSCLLERNISMPDDFILERTKLYNSSIVNISDVQKYGPILIAEFVAQCQINLLSIMVDELQDISLVVSELIRTAILRNDDLANTHTIIDG